MHLYRKIACSRGEISLCSKTKCTPIFFYIIDMSAYRKFHSTETALLRVHNDISVSLDKGHVTALTLLDLSAAFDTIDHNTLIFQAMD